MMMARSISALRRFIMKSKRRANTSKKTMAITRTITRIEAANRTTKRGRSPLFYSFQMNIRLSDGSIARLRTNGKFSSRCGCRKIAFCRCTPRLPINR